MTTYDIMMFCDNKVTRNFFLKKCRTGKHKVNFHLLEMYGSSVNNQPVGTPQEHHICQLLDTDEVLSFLARQVPKTWKVQFVPLCHRF